MTKTKNKIKIEKKIRKQKKKLDSLVTLKKRFKINNKKVPIKLKRKIKEKHNKIILLQGLLEE